MVNGDILIILNAQNAPSFLIIWIHNRSSLDDYTDILYNGTTCNPRSLSFSVMHQVMNEKKKLSMQQNFHSCPNSHKAASCRLPQWHRKTKWTSPFITKNKFDITELNEQDSFRPIETDYWLQYWYWWSKHVIKYNTCQ